jgi:uncharacterized protein YneF (UPF0154 family)
MTTNEILLGLQVLVICFVLGIIVGDLLGRRK